MRKLLPIAVALALLTASNAYTQDDLPEALKNCLKNEITIALCSKHKFDAADAELNDLYKQILAVMVTPQAKTRLKMAQRTWVELRDRDCLVLVGPREKGGSMYSGLWSKCLERRTRERTLELQKLQQLLKCEERPCPPNE